MHFADHRLSVVLQNYILFPQQFLIMKGFVFFVELCQYLVATLFPCYTNPDLDVPIVLGGLSKRNYQFVDTMCIRLPCCIEEPNKWKYSINQSDGQNKTYAVVMCRSDSEIVIGIESEWGISNY